MRLIDADKLEKKLMDAIAFGRIRDLDGTAELQAVLSDVENMPTIEPERKNGKWIYKNDLKQFFCSECGFPSLTYDDTYIYSMDLPNYFEDCGAKMQKPEDDIPMEYFESGGR